MAQIPDAKMKEAQKLQKDGEKHCKSSFFHKPKRDDWDSAAACFDKAAGIYLHYKMKDEAKKVYAQAADAHFRARNFFFSGKSWEHVAGINKDEKKLMDAVEAYKQAAMAYLEDNKLDKQAETLTKAATLIQNEHPEDAIDLLQSACDQFADEEKWHVCDKAFRTLTTVQLKAQKYDDAIATIKKQFPGHRALESPAFICKGYAECIIIQLHRDNFAAAQAEYDEAVSKEPDFQYSDEGNAIGGLLAAWEAGEAEQFDSAKKETIFTFLQPEIARMTKKLILGAGPSPMGADASGLKVDPENLEDPDAEDDLR
eukprot:TRINITY_DN23098_c0_g1_i1.p1 TRINITY_DN23098_c0_g1~~TRINITY_DN23098_c0_g1_i1.p1  ORF type:complete len:313 (+),score=44.98 TRINITY_DN23098_c0_g1_i1:51-989(+)